MPGVYKKGLYIGFDFGLSFIGVAVGQTTTGGARPETTLKAQQGSPRWERIEDLVKKWNPVGFVVGIPLNMNGTEQPITQAAKRFSRRLEGRFNIPVYTEDERLTTIEAKAQLFEGGGYRSLDKESIDSYAASIILGDWLKRNFEQEL